MAFDPAEKRDRQGKWVRVAPILASDLSSGDARRSPEVSDAEFQRHAKRGKAKMAARLGGASPASALEGPRFKRLTDEAYAASREPWGGITADSHTGEHVKPDLDAYALSIRKHGVDSVSVDPAASREEFDNAMGQARERFSHELTLPGAHLGVFHDADLKRIDIDPVLVTPSLEDVHDIGAYTRALGGAYHFKSGDGYWPPHVKGKRMGKNKGRRKAQGLTADMAVQTPVLHTTDYDLSARDGKLAFWKQILPIKTVHYTAKDGSRQVMNFTREYLEGLAKAQAVDSTGFLLADTENRHTMDPERWRGKVEKYEVREDGLYGKITFPSQEAARAVIENPELGVSARIRPNVQRDDGTTVPAGIIHVLGTLDPQVQGMKPWEPTDLSKGTDEVLDLSDEEYEDTMPDLDITTLTNEAIDKLSDADLDALLTDLGLDPADYADLEPEDVKPEGDEKLEAEKTAETKVPALAGAGADMSNADLELARQETVAAQATAREALRRVADAEWRERRNAYMADGVPAFALDLAAPILNRADDMVIDLSNQGETDVNASEIVTKLLDALKGTVDLSNEQGHFGTHSGDDNPDQAILDRWNI